MIERLVLRLFNVKERKSWHMFLVGLIYASLAVGVVTWFFSNNNTLSEASGMMVIAFCVMFSLPYMYKILRREEKEDEGIEGLWQVLKAHSDVVMSFLWLFLGFVIALSFWHILLQDANILNFQIQTYCQINSGSQEALKNCVAKYSPNKEIPRTTGNAVSLKRLFGILGNNLQVMVFSIIFSVIFGAGAIFVLAWNASVIAAAIGVFTKYNITEIPIGVARYMIHGIPEIASYFIAALAGGLVGISALKNRFKGERFLRVLENSIILVFIAILILIIAAVMEVYLTPMIF